MTELLKSILHNYHSIDILMRNTIEVFHVIKVLSITPYLVAVMNKIKTFLNKAKTI